MTTRSAYMSKKLLLAQLAVCLSVIFIAVENSWSPEPAVRTSNILASANKSGSLFGASRGRDRVKVCPAHENPWEGGITGQLPCVAATDSGDYAHSWRSTFKNVYNYIGNGITLNGCTERTTEIIDNESHCAIDHLRPDFNSKRLTIGVSIADHDVSWKGIGGNLTGASVIVELWDHVLFKRTAEAPALNLTSRQAELIRISEAKVRHHDLSFGAPP